MTPPSSTATNNIPLSQQFDIGYPPLSLSTTLAKQQQQQQENEEMNFDVEQQGGIQFTVEQPQFKFCKKRKEFFSNEYDPIWYKSPYKYNMRMKVTSSKNCLTDDLFTRLVVTHDDGSAVKFKGETITFSHGTQNYQQQQQTLAASSVVKSEENQANNSTEAVTATPTPTPTVKRRTKQSAPTRYHELKVGPFQFNVCSYKFDGKKFRLSIHVFQKLSSSMSATNERQQQEREICVLTSPAFLIKAKKPIAKPGIKSHKRSFDEMNQQQQQQASNHQASPPLVIVPGVGGVGGDFCSSPSSPSNSSTHSNHGALGVISSSCPSSPGGSCSSSSSCLSSPPCSPLPPSMFSGGVSTVNSATARGLSSPTSASAAAAAAAFYFGGNAGGVAADGNNGNNSATETAAAVAAAALAADNYQMLENQLFQFRYMLNNLIQQQSVIIQQPPSQLSPQHQHHQHPQAPGFTSPHLQHQQHQQHHHYDTVVDVNGMNKRMRLSPPHLLEYSTEVAMNPPMMPSMIAPPPTPTTTTAQQQQQQQLFNPYMTTTSSPAIAANSGLSQQQLPPFLPYPVVPSSTMQQQQQQHQQSNEMSVHSSTSTNTMTTTTTTTTTSNMVGPSLSTTFNSSSSTILPSLAPFDEFGSYLEMDHLPFHDQQQQSISVVGGCGGTTAVSGSGGELNALSHHSRGNMMSSFDMMNDHPTRSELVDLEDLLPPSQVFLL